MNINYIQNGNLYGDTQHNPIVLTEIYNDFMAKITQKLLFRLCQRISPAPAI